MKELFTTEEIARITRGTRWNGGRRTVAGVRIDSREVVDGSLFIALPGTRTDGHEFLDAAARSGARALLVRRKWWQKRGGGRKTALRGMDVEVIAVDDTLKSLQALAACHMRRYPSTSRIGVTGSNGKTTTKELIGGILSETASTVASRGNLNSEIGLPLMAFEVSEGVQFAVFEMGTNHPGEMAVLSDIVRPNLALITNIGTAHVEFFGSVAAIAREKKRIFDYFQAEDTGFLYEGEPYYAELTRGVNGKMVSFGPGSTEGYGGSRDLGLDGTSINWEGLQIHFPLFGEHNLLNALGAVTLCRSAGADRRAVKAGLEAARPLFARSQVVRGRITIIEDCYNANPDSMKTVLRFFESLQWFGRKIAVLGNMLELGGDGPRAHEEVARLAVALSLNGCFFFGEGWDEARSKLPTPAEDDGWTWTNDFDTLLKVLLEAVRPGDLVILKGSRGTELERLVDPLMRSAA